MAYLGEDVLRANGSIPEVAVRRDGQQVTVTLTGSADGLFRFATNLIESDRTTFRIVGEAIASGAVAASAVAAEPDQVRCDDCGTCALHGGCADRTDPVDLERGDCAVCGACGDCIAECARVDGAP